MAIEEEPEVGIPEWVVTFGDMMSLLLTFFIMLVSMSELKQEEKFMAMVEAFQQQFGQHRTDAAIVPGDSRPRNSVHKEYVHSLGRSKRKHANEGGQDVEAIIGENEKVQIIRPGEDTSVGGVAFFDEDSVKLTEQSKRDLYLIIKQIQGKPQKVEIRGHTSRKPVDTKSGYNDHMDLAYARSRSTREFLVASGIESSRIRLSAAGASEPLYDGVDPERLKLNSRVQILMWDERVQDLGGSDGPATIPAP
ncbi:flagellar motor protein MotB [Pirellulales bacterium]|nr:flagellar motor protein MotB [Pirellulales bacterium]